jgi:myosin heavy subunit
VEGVEDAAEFDVVCDSMRKLGFSNVEMRTIFRYSD